MKKISYLIIILLSIFCLNIKVYALEGVVNVNDSLTLRNSPSATGGYITGFSNGTILNIKNTNAGSDNDCSKWYEVSYGNYSGYSCGDYIILRTNNSTEDDDDSYSSNNYSNALVKDGSIMCYEDTGALSLRSSANGNRTDNKVNCGDKVNILATEKISNASCPYWYKINDGTNTGYVCSYYVNTTKLSSIANNYYNNKTNGDTVISYQNRLSSLGFDASYYPYLLELHARHPSWNFVAEKINLNFDDVVVGENGNGSNLLEGGFFDVGYLSTSSNTYNVLEDKFFEYTGESGYYNASKEAIAYFLDPRNYLNDKYIFAFETLGYSSNQNTSVVSSILSGQNFWGTVYGRSGALSDSTGSVSGDIVKASSSIGISAVHVSSRIKQEISNIPSSDSRLGGNFTYNGNTYSNYYNFFNIKSNCSNCSSIYSGYAYEKGWNTPFKCIYGGASLLAENYIKLNQDTLYYEKFDVSTTNGNYDHQYMQNLAATVQEGGISYNGYANNLASYFDTNITFVIPVYNNMPNYAVVAPSLGNPNNYLNNLTINGITVTGFSYNTYNYNVTLPSGTSSVNISAKKINSRASISGDGTININSDKQTSIIYVTSENGKTRQYAINFTRLAGDNNKTAATVVESMNNSGFKYNDNYMFGINVGTNVSSLIANISSYNSLNGITITSSNGSPKTNDSFRTGDNITITGSDGSKIYTAVIYGDVNGDGMISAVDYVKIKNYIMSSFNLDGSYLEAADVNKDGKVTAVDYVKIKNSIMGTGIINQ